MVSESGETKEEVIDKSLDEIYASSKHSNPGNAFSSGGFLLGEYDGNSAWKRDVVYLGGEALAEIDANGTHELHNDHLGSPRVITSRATGQVEGRQVFGPYGEKLPAFTSGYQPLTGYTGHVQQDPDGLTNMRGRFYTAAWHRFINSDQGVDPTTFNQMAYVGGSPFEAIDPSGMAKVKKGTKAWTKDRKLVECEAEGGCDTGSPEGWALAEAETGSKTVEEVVSIRFCKSLP